MGWSGKPIGAVFVGSPADESRNAGFGGEFDGLEEAFGFAGVRGDAAVGLVVDLETGVEGGLHGGSGRRGVGAFGPDGAFVMPVVEADVGEAGAGDAGVGAAAGMTVAGVGDGEGGEAVGHGSAKLSDGDWINRAAVGWGVNWRGGLRAAGRNEGASRAVRVFSKKLLRRRGVFFGGVWRRGARTGFRLNTPEWRVGAAGCYLAGTGAQ